METEALPPVNERQLGAILAGLRLLQRETPNGLSDGIYDVATNCGSFPSLNEVEIDNLCAELNGD